MAYTPHDVIKQEKLAEYAAALVDHDLTLSQVVTRESVDKFKGAEGDALTFRVPGRLPYRKLAWRDARENPIIRDFYKEAKVSIDWGGRIYSATAITDEQRDFDLDTWEPIISAQTAAVAQGVRDDIANTIANAPYEVTIGIEGVDNAIRPAIIEARRVLNQFRVPNSGSRILVVGSDFEAAMLNSDKIVLAQNVGDSRADSALSDAVLGRISGFTVILDNTIAPDEAYAFATSGFVQYTGAPSIPRSVYGGATVNVDGTTLRWLTDYDQDFTTDRSLVDTWVGSAVVKDMFLPKSALTESPEGVKYDPSTLKQHFVRGVKLSLDGESAYPSGADKADLIAETGVSSAKAFDAQKFVPADPTVIVNVAEPTP